MMLTNRYYDLIEATKPKKQPKKDGEAIVADIMKGAGLRFK